MKTIEVIADIEELKWFYTHAMDPLHEEEIYFISSSIRKKKLTVEQKEIIPHNEMFNKQQVIHDSWTSFYRGFRRLEVPVDAYFPVEAEPWINDSIVTYLNICPIDCLNAVNDQMTYLQECLFSMSRASFKGSENARKDCLGKITHSFSNIQSLFARNFGHKAWLDIDIDAKDIDKCYKEIRAAADEKYGAENHIDVRTGGGLHMLVRKSVLHDDIRIFMKTVEKIYFDIMGKNPEEIIVNKNQMIPAPGTFQYGKPVTILNKGSQPELRLI